MHHFQSFLERKLNLIVIWKYTLLKICELCFIFNFVLTSLQVQILLHSQSTNFQLRLKSCLQLRLMDNQPVLLWPEGD